MAKAKAKSRGAKQKADEKRPAIDGVIELGDLARDRITGFEGVVVAATKWLENCDRIMLQPQKIKSDGSPHSPQSFDLPSCELIEKGVFQQKRPLTGGPAPRGVEASRD